MNPIELLHNELANLFPNARLRVTPPIRDGGVWSLDIDFRNRHLAVEWHPDKGFGISDTQAETYGESPDEFVDSALKAKERLTALLSRDERTTPPLPVLLARLRESRGLTQKALADKLGIRQSTLSAIERRDDIQYSTIRRIVEALGGLLEVFAVFRDERYRLQVGPGDPAIPVPDLRCYNAGEPRQSTIRSNPPLSASTFENLANTGQLQRAERIQLAIRERHMLLEVQ